MPSLMHNNGKKMDKNGRCACESKISYYPEWYPINNHMNLDQRYPKPSIWYCFATSCQKNTELSCTWTHLIGFLFTVQGFWLFMQKPDDHFLHPKEEKMLFTVSFAAGCMCLGFSTIYHIMHCHSHRYYKLSLRLDLLGIVMGTQGPWYPWIYYTFYCDATLRYTFWTIVAACGVTATLLFTTTALLLQECMAKYRAMIASAVFSLIVPVYGIMFYRDGFAYTVTEGQQGWGMVGFAAGGLAVLVYCSKIPESLYSGRYDFLIGSHAIFHVLAATCLWLSIYVNMLMQEQRRAVGENCPG